MSPSVVYKTSQNVFPWKAPRPCYFRIFQENTSPKPYHALTLSLALRELGLKEPLRGLLSLEPLLGLLEASRRFLALRHDGEDSRHGQEERGEEVRSSTHGDWL